MRRRQLDLMVVVMFCLVPSASYGQVPQEDTICRVGRGVTAPTAIYRVKPEYTEDGRRAGISGVVELECIIHKDGTITISRVFRGMGFGLDERRAGRYRSGDLIRLRKTANPSMSR